MSLSEGTKRLLAGGEDIEVEYKTKVTQDFNDTLVAFANASGGVCLIGVEDAEDENGRHIGRVVGIEICDRTRGQIQSRADQTLDRIPISIEDETDEDGRGIYIVSIPEGQSKPYCTGGGRYLIRRDGQKCPMTPRMIGNFYVHTGPTPALALRWREADIDRKTCLDVPALPELSRESLLEKIASLMPTDGEIAIVNEHTPRIKHYLEACQQKFTEFGGPLVTVEVDDIEKFFAYVDKLRKLARKVEEDCNAVNRGIDAVSRAVEPMLVLTNNGTAPAENITVFLTPNAKIEFKYMGQVKQLSISIPEGRPDYVVGIVELAKRTDRELAEMTYRAEHGMGSEWSMAQRLGLVRMRKNATLLSVDNPNTFDILHKVPRLFMDGDRIRLDCTRLSHNFENTPKSGELRLLCSLRAGEEAELHYECNADNLPIRQRGVLKVIGKALEVD
ncbi:MAG TPA: ATP-binding protein [bacterium]|jgi:hypothetical protein